MIKNIKNIFFATPISPSLYAKVRERLKNKEGIIKWPGEKQAMKNFRGWDAG